MRCLALICLVASPAIGDALPPYTVENAAAIPAPLAEWSGPVGAGAAVLADAGCLSCHQAPGAADASAMGPDLTGVAARLTGGEIRLMIVNPSIVFPETEMPAYYKVGVYGEASDELVGRTRLSAVEVEQLVTYLSTFTQPRDDAATGGDKAGDGG